MTGRNRLATETSPYLRQHADQPVEWYPWGPEAFAAARELDRPILLSVGYSACHWCHVMAHESFEDDEVAAVMNASFVNVKVDREERPDVDALYMEAVQAMTGRGGWPMTAFLTPEGKPFYGGTYFPKPQFLQLLAALDEVWRTKRADVDKNVAELMKAVSGSSTAAPATQIPGLSELNAVLQALANNFDKEWGGFGTAPKFPNPMNLELLLRVAVFGKSQGAGAIVTLSLDSMAAGGIYDHLGGGFARYSTDRQWLVPHFEKMLYDQALLARLYLHAWQASGEVRFLQVLTETIGYVLRDLRQPGGGFASAEDADSLAPDGVRREGAFSTWTPAEVRAVLGDAADEALAWYGITEEGHFEGRSIPNRSHERGRLLRPPSIDAARNALFAARNRRPRPLLDDKVIAEWNGLMLATLAEAAAATGRTEWLEAAIANGEFLACELRGSDGRWRRSWQAEGGARHAALAQDLAALVDAFTRLGEASGQARWIELAVETADELLDHHWDPGPGGVFTVADDAEQLVVRQKDLLDNATPSANSTAAVALARLAALTGELRYAHQADQILQLLAPLVSTAPAAFGNFLGAVDRRRIGISEIAVVGDRPDLVRAVHRPYLPDVVVAWGEPYDSPLWENRSDGFAYVCRQYACQAPQDTPEGLLAQLTSPPAG